MPSEEPENGDLRDVLIVAHYQRMSHYGIAGFGTGDALMPMPLA